MGGSLGEAHADSIVRAAAAGRATRACPVVGFVESGGARLQEGHAALAGYGRIFRASVELSRRVPQISVVERRLRRRRRLLAGADRLRRDDRGGADVPDRPASRRRGDGRRGLDGGARRPRGPRAQRRLPPGRRRRREAAIGSARASCSGCCRSRIGSAPEPAIPTGPDPGDPAAVVPDRGAARSTTSATWPARILDGGSHARARPPLGAATWSPRFARLEGRPVGVVANQPKRARRRDRRRRGREGGALRRLLRPLRPAAGGPRRHPRVHARHAPGGRRGDPPRRLAAARVRRRPGAEGDGGPPQGLRRRRDHDELEGPRRRPRLRLARRGDRDHGRRGRRSASSTGGAWPRPRTRLRRSATSSPTPTPAST